MKRKILNLVMLAVVIALAIGVYFASRPKHTAPKPPLTALNSTTINSIAIERPKHKTLTLKRADGRWRFTAPIKVQASSANINSILAVATAPCEQQLKTKNVKLANLGLAPPKYSVTFNKTKVDIGMVEPLKYLRYARVGGKICLISNPSAPGLGSQDYANLVSTALVPAGRTLVKIAIPGYTATRNAQSAARESTKAKTGSKTASEWVLSPAGSALAKDAADKLAKAWQDANALWNTRVTGKTKAPAKTEYATLYFKDGGKLRYEIAKRTPQLKLERRDIGIEYGLSGTETAKLLEPAKATTISKAEQPKHSATRSTAGKKK